MRRDKGAKGAAAAQIGRHTPFPCINYARAIPIHLQFIMLYTDGEG
jgi:hypothetical protein